MQQRFTSRLRYFSFFLLFSRGGFPFEIWKRFENIKSDSAVKECSFVCYSHFLIIIHFGLISGHNNIISHHEKTAEQLNSRPRHYFIFRWNIFAYKQTWHSLNILFNCRPQQLLFLENNMNTRQHRSHLSFHNDPHHHNFHHVHKNSNTSARKLWDEAREKSIVWLPSVEMIILRWKRAN